MSPVTRRRKVYLKNLIIVMLLRRVDFLPSINSITFINKQMLRRVATMMRRKASTLDSGTSLVNQLNSVSLRMQLTETA